MNTTLKPPHGSENSSNKDILPPEWLTKDQSKTSRRWNSPVTRNAISSRESAAGPLLFDWRDGRIASPSGQDHVLASLSPRQAKARGLLTSATCGPLSNGSSTSAALQSSLESRLRARMDVNGSPEYALTWKTWTMQSGPRICALRASKRNTSGNAFGGLPTPSGIGGTKGSHGVGALGEWGGSGNPFRGTELGNVRCASFELWMMGYPMEWWAAMVRATQSFPKSRRNSSKPALKQYASNSLTPLFPPPHHDSLHCRII